MLLTHSRFRHRGVAVDAPSRGRGSRRPTGSAPAGRTRRSRRWSRRTARSERTRPEARPWYSSLQPGVRDDQLAAVEDVVADQAVAEGRTRLRNSSSARRPAARATRPGRARPVTLRPSQRAHQLVLVVAGDAQRVPGGDHAHHQPQHARACPGRGRPGRRRTRAVRPSGCAASTGGRARRGRWCSRAGQQRLELGAAAVHVADDVERAGELALVVVGLLVGDDAPRRPPRRRRSTWTLRKPSRSRPRSAAAQLAALPPDHVRGRSRGRSSRRRCARRTPARGRPARSRPAARRARGPASPATRGPWAARWSRRRRSAGRGAGGCRRCSAAASKASPVADWSFSSSATRPRQESEETTAVGGSACGRRWTCPSRWCRSGRPGTVRGRRAGVRPGLGPTGSRGRRVIGDGRFRHQPRPLLDLPRSSESSRW